MHGLVIRARFRDPTQRGSKQARQRRTLSRFVFLRRKIAILGDYTQVSVHLCIVFSVYRDTDYVEGDWSAPGRIEDVLEIVKGWDPRCAVAISKAPSCVD